MQFCNLEGGEGDQFVREGDAAGEGMELLPLSRCYYSMFLTVDATTPKVSGTLEPLHSTRRCVAAWDLPSAGNKFSAVPRLPLTKYTTNKWEMIILSSLEAIT